MPTQQPSERLALVSATFVELIDTLVDDFDVIDLLTILVSRTVELVGAEEGGILLADDSGQLRVVAASSEQIGLLELFQVQNEQGPCMDCYRTGEPTIEPDLSHSTRWPRFAAESVAAGYRSVCAVPLRLRTSTLGCLNMFMSAPFPLARDDVDLAQALTDVATIAIAQDQAARDAAVREGRLENALTSRIVIEQAKGIIAEFHSVDMDAAFQVLRTYSRSNNLRLTLVAESLISGRRSPAELTT